MNRQDDLLRLNAAWTRHSEEALRLVSEFSAGELFKATAGDWARVSGAPQWACEALRRRALAFDPGAERRKAASLGARLIFCGEPEYPALLGEIPDFPLALYVFGSFAPGNLAIAFVGSRRPSPYGRRVVRSLVADAAEAGVAVVSGLARGIDSQAHEAALACGAATWAVLGSGLARIYPPENRGLVERITAAGGCVLSEFPMETDPSPFNFPRRNRIISGLCRAVIVVEGALRSGSLITARLAAEQGREVFAVPGPLDSPMSQAPHWLIQQGARLLRGMEDVWQILPPPELEKRGQARGRTSGPRLPLEQEKILEFIGSESPTLEEVGLASGLDLPHLSHTLLQMELAGLVEPLAGQRYAKKETQSVGR